MLKRERSISDVSRSCGGGEQLPLRKVGEVLLQITISPLPDEDQHLMLSSPFCVISYLMIRNY